MSTKIPFMKQNQLQTRRNRVSCEVHGRCSGEQEQPGALIIGWRLTAEAPPTQFSLAPRNSNLFINLSRQWQHDNSCAISVAWCSNA